MNILMVTNTYPPHVGGVAVSVKSQVDKLFEEGHKVLVLAPTFEGVEEYEDKNVVRVAAIQNFNGSDFSVRLPIPTFLFSRLNEFRPDLVHSHHPFLMGDTAIRIAAKWDVPLVFTHHTKYEDYTHYVPGNSPALKKFVIRLSSGYANLCQRVIAPSESIKKLLLQRGVTTPIDVVPTGIDTLRFGKGDPDKYRSKFGIPESATVVGHLGRLAAEKNLIFLTKAVRAFLENQISAHFIIVGEGSAEAEIKKLLSSQHLSNRIHFTGTLQGQELVDALHAMDLFVFASKTETQGLVVAEAMAAGLPVIALEASGIVEVVKDGYNGRLIQQENTRLFSRAIREHFELSPEKRQDLSSNCKQTAECLSLSNTCRLLTETYQSTIESNIAAPSFEHSTWDSTLGLIEAEWALMKNRMQATGLTSWLKKIYLLIRHSHWISRIRGFLNRSELTIKLLKLEKYPPTDKQRGIILIQIDGLSKPQFEQALTRKKLRFLDYLINSQHYDVQTFYSGIPSTTPAVQGELFYNVRAAVPAFSYYSRRFNRDMVMYDTNCVAAVENNLAAQEKGLLEGGSSYSDAFTGGAKEPHLSPAALGWKHFQRWLAPRSLIYLTLWHLKTAPRFIVLAIIEFFLAIGDFLTGIDRGYSLFKEIKFIPTRLLVTVLLRETITVGTILDITRGVPIIHLNLLGYDEQSHRRGPSSRFAHWSLKGIDSAIKRIWKCAQQSHIRRYQVWIYSDHGQESSIPFEKAHGVSIEEAISKALQNGPSQIASFAPRIGQQLLRSAFLRKRPAAPEQLTADSPEEAPRIQALGPVGHIYLPSPPSSLLEKKTMAHNFVEQGVPSVLFSYQKSVFWCNEKGIHNYDEYASECFDSQLPFFHELLGDLRALALHTDAGDFVILGYKGRYEPYLTFVHENGSHGGPGPEETQGILLRPASFSQTQSSKGFIRPSELRNEVQQYIQRAAAKNPVATGRIKPASDVIRVMTYNIRSGLGSDNRFCLERIADVIEMYKPDLACLQEVDVARQRSSGINQAHELASSLNMDYFFYPAMEINKELYGNAILTSLPFRLIKATTLPPLPGSLGLEPRCSIWLELDLDHKKLQLVNTHLSLKRREREIQMNEILGPRWIKPQQANNNPIILCGDFNATSKSHIYKRVSTLLNDTTMGESAGMRSYATWPSYLPLLRLDYIFTSSNIKTKRTFVARDATSLAASDHLPLISDLIIGNQ